MKTALIAANWKSNMTKSEALDWISGLSLSEAPQDKKLLILSPFTLLDFLKSQIEEKNLPILLGAQNVSPFGAGAYSGEINAEQIKEFAEYVLIGHSERRNNFSETNEVILRKIDQAREQNLKIILCISDLAELDGVSESDSLTIAYEPIASIGSGNPDEPSHTKEMAESIKEKIPADVIYGGSVNAANINSYLAIDSLDGVLIGNESLDPHSFSEIIHA